MKALVLRRPYDVMVSEVATPEPAHDQVLVRMTNSGICGTDLKIFTGAMPARYPVIMGHEMAGEVLDGADGSRLRRGDRVLVDPVLFCGACFDCRAGRTNLCPNGAVIGREVDGGFADFVVAPRSHVYPLPPSIDSRTAPLIQVLTTVLHAQRRASITTGQSVAVIGLGVSGQLHLQLAKARGAGPVIGVTRSAWKRSVAERLGADLTVSTGDEGIQAVRGVVIESTGMVKCIGEAISMVRPGGTVVLFGIYTASEGALPFYQLYYKEPIVISARAAMGEDFPESIDLVARGRITLDPLVTQVLPVDQLTHALGLLDSDADGRMKIILDN
jgi:2-desacetyl-2-hydroxyethyl bacteriochlorophyllide A dehydrogenase